MRLTALFVLALTLSGASSAVASAPIRTSVSHTGTAVTAPGELCSFGVLFEWRDSSEWTGFADFSWMSHHVHDATFTNQATGGFITAHATYNVMFDPVDYGSTVKTTVRGLLYQVRDANGHVVSTSAGLYAIQWGSPQKVTPNAAPFLLLTPTELICAPLAEAAP